MSTRTAIGAADDDFGRLLRILSAIGTVAAAMLVLRRFFG